ncbi:MAG: ATP-dependent sacrificial sulfur transferase LarE [Myxococcales bacterium]|nr:ATP-dependent sacrificial sulfur transferase LarE [Myxococcales bacterium]
MEAPAGRRPLWPSIRGARGNRTLVRGLGSRFWIPLWRALAGCDGPALRSSRLRSRSWREEGRQLRGSEVTQAQPEARYAALVELLRDLSKGADLVVTFSGGVDSALVLAAAVEAVGARAIALTAVSPTLPIEETEAAVALARELGATHELVDAHELDNEAYAANTGDRCYHCKTELFDLAVVAARARGAGAIVDGTIVDDLAGHRPGLRAAAEHGVHHPLVTVGYTKPEVRAAARALGIRAWDKPSFACLGSRFAPGTRVTLDRILRVARVESALRREGFRQFRVRYQQVAGDGVGASVAEQARIELDPAEIPRLVAAGVRERVLAAGRAEGFDRVSLDLEGYGARPG